MQDDSKYYEQEGFLCGECYLKKYGIDSVEDIDFNWIGMIPCKICNSVPVIWRKKGKNNE